MTNEHEDILNGRICYNCKQPFFEDDGRTLKEYGEMTSCAGCKKKIDEWRAKHPQEVVKKVTLTIKVKPLKQESAFVEDRYKRFVQAFWDSRKRK